jgi:DMSO/TMAO reductase YedYZ molybdopterin-dependent catalytic subunit
MTSLITRRALIVGAAAGGAALASACDRLNASGSFRSVLELGEWANRNVQRLIVPDKVLAREFAESDMSPVFRSNGTSQPETSEYLRLQEENFAGWRLVVDGLVENPFSLSLAELRRLPARTQITRHDCVEGWSAIGKWTGARLAPILQAARLSANARYLVFHCADELERTADESGRYYESIDLVDAFHAQTILAYEMNGAPLPVAHGAPLRLRVERHLGYKHAKYVMRIEAVESFVQIGRGRGGFWEDRGYEWYAGI